jgi:colicin import membrane protein
MQASADALAFTPPPEPAAVRGFVLAVIAHLILVIALSLGINWDKDTAPAPVEAELWSALPQEAAPPPAPVPEPQVVTAPPVVQPPPQPVEKQPDIQVEREKKRKEQEAKRREEEELRKEQEAQKRKLEEQKRVADEKKQRDEQAKKEKLQKEKEAKLREQARNDQIARMQALAAGTGSPTSQGRAAKSSGPSDSWSGRIQRAVYPNIVFTQHLDKKIRVGVEIHLSPDGTVVGEPVVREPSGNSVWDDAVVRGIKKTGVLPRDIDGKVYSPALIGFTREAQ